MYVKEVTVENQVGLHARPATFFIQKANEYKSSIWVEKEERRVNAKSLCWVFCPWESWAAPPSASLRTARMSRRLWMAWSSWSAPALPSNLFQTEIQGECWRAERSAAFCVSECPILRISGAGALSDNKRERASRIMKGTVCCRFCPVCISSGTKRTTIIYIGKAKRLQDPRVSSISVRACPTTPRSRQMINHAFTV